jgi:flagellar biosynthesis protein FlhA
MDLRNRWPDYLLPVGIIACLMVIFVPLPPAVMDLLLAGNISIAVVILLSTVYVKTPLELNIFPSLLLATTLARLALNIGTTRLILTRGAVDGEMAAGGVIHSFSQFVTGDSLAVGLVIFSIIVIVQFVVITKGSTRISEVAARFALDGMPGRQMAIDAELNAGTIDNEQAKTLRQETIAHADFYGAMDGASKFVRGDAIAGVAITLINIVGGLIIGLASSMSLAEAAETFTKLTIGDGLVSQLPALLISLAAGLLVTRRTQRTDLPRESMQQVFARPIVLVLTAIFLGLLVMTELPKLPLLMIAGGCLGTAYVLTSGRKQDESIPTPNNAPPRKPAATEVTIDKLLNNEVMEMELGVGLIRLADSRQGGQLLALITSVRKSVAECMGVVLPKIRIRDNLNLNSEEFQIIIQGSVVKQGVVHVDSCLAIDNGHATGPIDNGAVTSVPEKGMIDSPGFWIQPDAYESTFNLGYQVLTADEVLADQLKRVALTNPAQVLTRDATRQLIDEVQKTSPAVIEELIPKQMSLGQIQQILKMLLEEGVSIRPLSLILETLGDNVAIVENQYDLVEKVRLRLARHITTSITGNAAAPLRAFSIADELQDRIGAAWERHLDEIRIGLPRHFVQSLAFAMEDAAKKMAAADLQPVVVVNQSIRPVIAELTIHFEPRLQVIGSREASNIDLQLVGEITAEHIQTAANPAA